jgi:hypothetical protein
MTEARRARDPVAELNPPPPNHEAIWGPRVRVLVLWNEDQTTRYPDTSPARFLNDPGSRWGDLLEVALISEQEVTAASLTEALDSHDVLLTLCGTLAQQETRAALREVQDDIDRWVRAGSAFVAVHPGFADDNT